ncbi:MULTISPECIES: nuclease A inhibitor family protein [Leptolyngbya]|uniref:nuclease A inhibitor family protein n=1 Tax=Leptolyngbya TaxID=47251 RepID=UPI001686D167|nr:nuclease A inhibitor family protein [Leptolyngbya sp. FACHB-1624]MBD1854551.1 nuclease A inhibitor family protein [Leptolyngbya sp. FACHB-1624]
MQENYQSCELVTVLKELTENLMWMSETDAPIQVFCWKNGGVIPSNEQLLEQTQHSKTTPVEVVEVDQFFAPVVTEQDWFEEEERETAAKYRALLSILREHLTDLKVYRVGAVEIDVYVVGLSEENVIGIATQVVET